MELTECSITSARKIQTTGNHPKERIQHNRKCLQNNTLLELSRKPSNRSDNGNLGNHSNNGNFGDNSKQQNNNYKFMTHVRAIIDSYTNSNKIHNITTQYYNTNRSIKISQLQHLSALFASSSGSAHQLYVQNTG